MKIKTVTVQCEVGLHLRIAVEVANIVKKWGGAVHILCKEGKCRARRVNACSAMELLLLGAAAGTLLKIIAEGPNEGSVLRDLAALIETASPSETCVPVFTYSRPLGAAVPVANGPGQKRADAKTVQRRRNAVAEPCGACQKRDRQDQRLM